MKKKRVYVDMDDTMCDFITEYRNRLLINPKIQYPQSQYGFFESLKPIQGALEGIKELDKYYDVWILTKPSVKNPWCYTGKRIWVENHLGIEWCDKLILSPDKSLLKGDYLIDDVIHEGFEGEHLHFGRDFLTWEEILIYLIYK